MQTPKFIHPRSNPGCHPRLVPHGLVHDLLQPLNACGLALEHLRESLAPLLPPDHEAFSFLSLIERAIRAEDELLSSLRRYFRHAGNAPPVRCGSIACTGVTMPVAAGFRARHPELSFEESSPEGLWVLSEQSHLVEILERLVDNAAQHAASCVKLTVRRHMSDVQIDIVDDGPGLAPQLAHLLGMPFVRSPPRRRDAYPGLGLGLFVAASLARRLNHQLSILRPAGPGCVFRLTLPIARPMPGSTHRPAADPLSGKRIAMVEQHGRQRPALAHMLSSWGCQVRTIPLDGKAEMLSFPDEAPDILVMDDTVSHRLLPLLEKRRESVPPGPLRIVVLIDTDVPDTRATSVHIPDIPVRNIRLPISPSRLRSVLIAFIGET